MADAKSAIRLGKRTVEAAPVKAAQYKLWDADLKGFGLKVSPGGAKTYFVRYRVGEGRAARGHEYTLGRHGELTAEEARAEAGRVLGRVRLGADPQTDRQKARAELTVAALCDFYLKEGVATKKESTLVADRARIKAHIKPLLGKKLISTVSSSDVARFMRDVAAGKTAVEVKPSRKDAKATGAKGKALTKVETRKRTDSNARGGKGTASRTVGLLGAIFTFATQEGLLTSNPVRGVERFRDQKSQRFLSKEEVANLTKALSDLEKDGANAHGVTVIRLLTLTGARKSEIEGLKWSEVDLERSCLRLEDSKTGARVLPIGAPAKQILGTLPRSAQSPFVFPSAKNPDGHYVGTPKLWEKVKREAELPGVRLHDLRHTFASFGIAGGLSLPLIAALLGHKDVKTTQQYAHLADDPVKAAADRTAGALAGLMELVPPVSSTGS